MNPIPFHDLLQFLDQKTGPGGPMSIEPGIRWTLLAPVPQMDEALKRAIKQEKYHIGVVMPYASARVKAARGPYDENQESGGALRELRFYTTVFYRSMKNWPLDGRWLLLEDWLEELFRTFNDSVGKTNQTVRLDGVNYLGEFPDILIMEGSASLRYFTDASRSPTRPLSGFIVHGNPERKLEPWAEWFRVYL